MEYVFGTEKKGGREFEYLKTVGNHHTHFTGRTVIERKYPDRTINDTFFALEKYRTREDMEGKCYDWYEISGHFRDTDRFMPQKQDIQAQIDYIAMMTDVDLEEA